LGCAQPKTEKAKAPAKPKAAKAKTAVKKAPTKKVGLLLSLLLLV